MFIGFNSTALKYLKRFNSLYPCGQFCYINRTYSYTTVFNVLTLRDGSLLEKRKETILYKNEYIITAYLTLNGEPVEKTRWTPEDIQQYFKDNYLED